MPKYKLPIFVETFDGKTDEQNGQTRRTDHEDKDAQTWLINHIHWALRHGMVVTIGPAEFEEKASEPQ